MPRRHTVIVVCVVLALAGLVGEGAPAAQVRLRTVAAAGGRLRVVAGSGVAVAAARAGSVIGIVRAPNNAATAVVQVRLRNLVTGRVEATTVVDSSGRFAFEQIESGNYVVEALDAKGRVVSVGTPLTVEAGEVVSTFVQTSPPIGFIGTFQTVASSMVSTAAGLGVTAVVPTGPAASPEQ